MNDEQKPTRIADQVVARFKAEAEAEAAAKAEKAQKRSAAELLADELRLVELKKIPQKQRTADEQREYNRLSTRKTRSKERGEGSPLDNVATVQEFWEGQGLLLTAVKRREYEAAQERILDCEYWMACGFECSEDDPDYVSLEEGLDEINRKVELNKTIHDWPRSYTSYQLRECNLLEPWNPQDFVDKLYGWIPAYFKNKDVMELLCRENEPTKVRAKFGYKTALSDYAVVKFRQNVIEHALGVGEHREIVPFGVGKRLEVEGCWLCGLERIQKARAATPQAVNTNSGGALSAEVKYERPI